MELNIRRLGTADATALIALRREALETEPLAFGSSPADDVALVIESVRRFLGDRETQAVFGQFNGSDLVGMIGLVKAAKVKLCHKATIWGTYVQPRGRNKGVGRALVGAAIEQARRWEIDQLQLSATDAAPAARRLYEAAGFQQWGREPRALHWDGRFVDEYHFVLRLGKAE